MGNCGSNPKTNEGPLDVPVPKPVTEEINVEQRETEATVETKTEETLNDENKSLKSLLDEVSHFSFKFQ